MANQAMWHFDHLLDGGTRERIVALVAIMKNILRNPVTSSVLEDIATGLIDKKSFSHYGAVYVNKKLVDLGNPPTLLVAKPW